LLKVWFSISSRPSFTLGDWACVPKKILMSF
jgi:hypothetical protein